MVAGAVDRRRQRKHRRFCIYVDNKDATTTVDSPFVSGEDCGHILYMPL